MSLKHRFLIVLWFGLGAATAFGQALSSNNNGDTPAHRAALKFLRGANFGNYLEYAAGDPTADATYTVNDFKMARSEGFTHIRLPVTWDIYCGPGPDFTLAPTIFNKVDQMVANALNNNLGIIIDIHHFDAFMADPNANSSQFYAIWQQIAAHYANQPDTVAFELLNEPNAGATTVLMNGIYGTAIRQIRQTNPNRTIFVGPGSYNSASELSKLSLPANDLNLIIAIHCYDPYYFTHQGAEWAYPDTKTVGVLFPGPPSAPLTPDKSITHDYVITWFKNYNRLPVSSNPSSPAAFLPILRTAKNWADSHNRPVHVGEFGCYNKADPQSRVNFYGAIRQSMDDLSVGWTTWDWKSGFHYEVNGVPQPLGMRQALFPQPTLTPSGKGGFSLSSALGKTFAIEKASALGNLANWQAISTQTLASPNLSFNDPHADQNTGFYRVRWLK